MSPNAPSNPIVTALRPAHSYQVKDRAPAETERDLLMERFMVPIEDDRRLARKAALALSWKGIERDEKRHLASPYHRAMRSRSTERAKARRARGAAPRHG